MVPRVVKGALFIIMPGCNGALTGPPYRPALRGEFTLISFGGSALPVSLFEPSADTDPPGCQADVRSGHLMIDHEDRFVIHLGILNSCRIPPPPTGVFGAVRQAGATLAFTTSSRPQFTGNYVAGEIRVDLIAFHSSPVVFLQLRLPSCAGAQTYIH